MKKLFVILVSLLCTLVLFSACNQDGTTEAPPTGDDPNAIPPAACQTHTWGEWQTVTPATCIAAGAQKHICTVCGESETVATTGAHNYQNDICTVCARSRFTSGLSYELTDDETGYTVTGIGEATDTDIVIAPTYNGKPVVAISGKAFRNNTKITSVEIPASVVGIGYTATTYSTRSCSSVDDLEESEEIEIEVPSREELLDRFFGGGTFEGCTALTRVTFAQGSALVGIGSNAFKNCSSLSEIVFPASLIEIKSNAFEGCVSLSAIALPTSLQNLGDGAFEGCSGVESISVAEGNAVYCGTGNCLVEIASKTLLYGCKNSIIPTDGSVVTIGNSAFENCSNLTSLTIPSTVTTIGQYAFNGCSGLTSLTIPASVTVIDRSGAMDCIPFVGCTGLQSITVAVENTVYRSEGNCLIEKETGLLLLGCQNSIIPADGQIKGIYPYAFAGCTGLTAVTIPESVTYIGSSAFENCTGLTAVTIPESVTTIENSVFRNCTGLTQMTMSSTTIVAAGYFGYKGLIACNWQYDGTNVPPTEDAFSEMVVFGGWYTDPAMTNAFDLDQWLSQGHVAGEGITLYTKLSKTAVLVPMMIERTAFETKIMAPLQAALSARDYAVFMAYFSLKQQNGAGIATAYPVTAEKGIDIYVYNDDPTNISIMRKLEALILAYTDYTFEELAADHAFVEYEQ